MIGEGMMGVEHEPKSLIRKKNLRKKTLTRRRGRARA